jgi:glycosyltransferase involved in cell wall biosynthesis
MHILILPPGHYVTKRAPLKGIFQYHQARAIRKKGINVGVLSAGIVSFRRFFSRYPYQSFEEKDGVKVYRHYKRMLVPGRIANKLLIKYLVGLYLKLFERYIIEQGVPDIIHAHNSLNAGVAALKIKIAHKIPYVITEHSTAYVRGLISRRQDRLIREVLKNADVKTVVSTKLGSLLETLYGEDACPNYPIFNILDDRFGKDANIVHNVKYDKDKFTFLNIAILVPKKNHSIFLEAFAVKFKGNSHVQLKIGGDGPLRKQLETKAKALGIEKQVVFTGLLSRKNVLLEMQNCDVFVLSSTFETFGVVLIEALACGKPVIATRSGGPENIINSNNGYLVPKEDVGALAKAMENSYLHIDKFDPYLIRKDCLLRFGEDAFVTRLNSVYTNLLKKKENQRNCYY